MMLASMAEREHLRTSILLVQNYKIYATFPRKTLKTVKKNVIFFAQHKDTETQRITEGKGTPLLRKEGLGVVDFPRELIWSLRLKLFLKLYLELFCTRILYYHY